MMKGEPERPTSEFKDAAKSHPIETKLMNREEKKDEIKGWLLALALATILTWYVIHPVPRPSTRLKLEDDLPEADRHQKWAQPGQTSRRFGMRPMPPAIPTSTDEDLPDWPDYIEVD